MKRLALAVLVCLAPSSVFADIMVTMTTPTTPPTITEGNTTDITFTLKNTFSFEVTGLRGFLEPTGITTGDLSDVPAAFLDPHAPGTCPTTTFSLAAGATCTMTFELSTDPRAAGETDGDQGVSYWTLAIGDGADNVYTSGSIPVTVTDPVDAPVPEPTSVFLFATVVAGSVLLMKRKQGRAGFRLR